MVGTDPKMESFLEKVIGCKFRFVAEMPLVKLNTQTTRQWSRLEENNPDYVAGIAETMRMGGYVPPVLLQPRSKDTFAILDGIHRVLAAKTVKSDAIAAYVLLDVDDEMAEFIASHVNVYVNGQGLSEEERRHHFLAALRKHSTDLIAINLRDRKIRISMQLLAIAPHTARAWVDVETFKARAAALGLKVPPTPDTSRTAGARSDAWILSVAKFTDEELQKYWLQLTGSHAGPIGKVARKLAKCTSTHQRTKLADALLPALTPTMRVMSQTQADQDRRSANVIRMHGSGLLKLAPEFERLAAKYDDVRTTLEDLRSILGVDADVKEDSITVAS